MRPNNGRFLEVVLAPVLDYILAESFLERKMEVGQSVWTEQERSGIFIECISADGFVTKSECFLFVGYLAIDEHD